MTGSSQESRGQRLGATETGCKRACIARKRRISLLLLASGMKTSREAVSTPALRRQDHVHRRSSGEGKAAGRTGFTDRR